MGEPTAAELARLEKLGKKLLSETEHLAKIEQEATLLHRLAVRKGERATVNKLDEVIGHIKMRGLVAGWKRDLAGTAQTTELMKLNEQVRLASQDVHDSIRDVEVIANDSELFEGVSHLRMRMEEFSEIHEGTPHVPQIGEQVEVVGLVTHNPFELERAKGTEFERKTVGMEVVPPGTRMLVIGRFPGKGGVVRTLLLEPLTTGQFLRGGGYRHVTRGRLLKTLDLSVTELRTVKLPSTEEMGRYWDRLGDVSTTALDTYGEALNKTQRMILATPVELAERAAPAATAPTQGDRAKANAFNSDAALADFERKAGMPIEKYNALTDAQRRVINQRMKEGKVGTTAKPQTSPAPSPTSTPPKAHVTRETIGPRITPVDLGPIPAVERARVKGLSDADLATELQAAQDRAAKVRKHPEASDVVKATQSAKVKLLLDEVLSRERLKTPPVPPDLAGIGWTRDAEGHYLKDGAPGVYTDEGARTFEERAKTAAKEKTRVVQRPSPPPGYRPPPKPFGFSAERKMFGASKQPVPLLSDEALDIIDLGWRRVSPEKQNVVAVELYKEDAALRMSLAEGNPEAFMLVTWMGKMYGVRVASMTGLVVALIGIGVPSLALELQDASER